MPAAVIQLGQEYRVSEAANAIRREWPKIHTFLSSLILQLGRNQYLPLFNTFLQASGVVAQYLTVIQGTKALERIGATMDAQTGLLAPQKFARQVYRFVKQRSAETRNDGSTHIFFVYHPDTDWHPEFFHHATHDRDPLPSNFLGLSENLDALCVWMKFLRGLMNKVQPGKIIQFHILIPAYRPLIIEEPLRFSDDLLPLSVEGHIHNSMPHVWMNLPDVSNELLTLSGIGEQATLPNEWTLGGVWNTLSSMFSAAERRSTRTLGEECKSCGESQSDEEREAEEEGIQDEIFVSEDIRKVHRKRRKHRKHRRHEHRE